MSIKTPCIGVCSTSLGDDICRGCGRGLEEIRDWAAMTDAERAAIMTRLEEKAMTQDNGMDAEPSWQELKETLDQVCDVFQIGERARSPSAILTNVENAARFSDYLHAIERGFLMAPGEPDADFPDEEPEDECLVNSWGARSREHYVEQFRRSLARQKAEWQAEVLGKVHNTMRMHRRDTPSISALDECIVYVAELRRQAEENDHDKR